jgi:hypothetical protein
VLTGACNARTDIIGQLREALEATVGAEPETDPAGGGLAMVAIERSRQRSRWSPEHDDGHRAGELAVRAAELAVNGTDERLSTTAHDPDAWGLVAKHGRDPVRSLTIAGALICAELDRLLRRQRLVNHGGSLTESGSFAPPEVFGFDTLGRAPTDEMGSALRHLGWGGRCTRNALTLPEGWEWSEDGNVAIGPRGRRWPPTDETEPGFPRSEILAAVDDHMMGNSYRLVDKRSSASVVREMSAEIKHLKGLLAGTREKLAQLLALLRVQGADQ